MSVVDGLHDSGVTKTGRLAAEHDALCVELKAGLRRVSVEELETESMERCHERYIRVLCYRVAQSERPVRRELGHHPIGDRLRAFVFFLLLRRAADLRPHAVDRSRI